MRYLGSMMEGAQELDGGSNPGYTTKELLDMEQAITSWSLT